MPNHESELAQARARLRAVEQQFEQQMRVRGFDPAQAEHLAFPGALADLYAQRQELRARLRQLLDDAGETTNEI
jgi:hypothetical protein